MSKSRIERQPCRVCGRVTMQEVTVVTSGGGRRIASRAKCLQHHEWTSGRIDVLGPDGEWKTVVAGAS
jgi:hypothetical protein